MAEKLGLGEAGADGLQVVTEAPPAHEPQSNGMVESGVKQVKGMARTLMLALESRIQGASQCIIRLCCGSWSMRLS